MDVNNVSIV
jgi:hypothetical protein